MSKEETERLRRERISEALKHYYSSDNGTLQRNALASRQRLRMSRYNEYLRIIDNNNDIKTKDNEKS